MVRIAPRALRALVAPLVLFSPAALAQAPAKLQSLQPEYVAGADQLAFEARDQGLSWKVSTGATVNIGDNRNVVGQASGTSVTLGAKFDSTLDYNRGKHELRNIVSFSQGVTSTPLVPDFVKSADSLSLESIYLYHFIEWAGLFGRLYTQTSMFRGADVRPAGYSFQITRADGRVETVGGNADGLNRLPLSDPFQPLVMKQSVGPFARPVSGERVNLEIRAGVGARETVAQGQLALADDAVKTPTVIEVKELSNVNQIGAEFAASTWGELYEKRVSYRVAVEVMVPVGHNPLTPEELEALEPGRTEQPPALLLTNVDVLAKLSFKLVDWASLDYELKAIRQPQLLSAFQVQNTLLLTFGLSRASAH